MIYQETEPEWHTSLISFNFQADYWLALPFCFMILFSTIDTFSFECLLPETKGKPLIENMPPRHLWLFGNTIKEEDISESEQLEPSSECV